ncbi:unnamed protein product [Brassica rapa subsp. trilocularis]
MASSKVSSMLRFLFLLVLLLHHMDKAIGEQIQLSNRKLKETGHHDQLTAGQRRVLMGIGGNGAGDFIIKHGRKIPKLFRKLFSPPPPA